MKTPSKMVPLTQAALMLQMRYQRAMDLVLCGEIIGKQEANKRWFVELASIDRYLERRQ